MFVIKERAEKKVTKNIGNERINATQHYLVVSDNKPIDGCALRYALLKCCDDVCVLTLNNKMYMSGPNSRRIRDFEEIEVPGKYDEFKMTEYEFMLPYIGDAAVMLIATPDSANELMIYRSFHSSSTTDEQCINSINKAYDYYNSIYEEVEVPEYNVVTIDGMKFIKEELESRTSFRGFLSDAQKNRVGSNIMNFADSEGIEWNGTIAQNNEETIISNGQKFLNTDKMQIESITLWHNHNRVSISEYPLLVNFSLQILNDRENADVILNRIISGQ